MKKQNAPVTDYFLIIFIVILGIVLFLNYIYDNQTKMIENTNFSDTNYNKNMETTALELVRIRSKIEEIQKTLKKPSYDYLKSVTVYITGISISKELSFQSWVGTGTIIAKKNDYTYILTNSHIIGKTFDYQTNIFEDSNAIIYVHDGDYPLNAEVVNYKIFTDLAIIRIKGTIKNKQSIKGFGNISIQDKVFLCGHHLGRKYIYGEGFFAGYNNGNAIIQLPILSGDSGSGVFNTSGELIAVVFAVAHLMDGVPIVDVAHGICIDIESIRKFYNETMQGDYEKRNSFSILY